MMPRDKMIEKFLELWVAEEQHHDARIALTMIAEILERRAALKGSLCADLTPRRTAS